MRRIVLMIGLLAAMARTAGADPITYTMLGTLSDVSDSLAAYGLHNGDAYDVTMDFIPSDVYPDRWTNYLAILTVNDTYVMKGSYVPYVSPFDSVYPTRAGAPAFGFASFWTIFMPDVDTLGWFAAGMTLPLPDGHHEDVFFSGTNTSFMTTPEPSSLGLMLMAWSALLIGRRHQRASSKNRVSSNCAIAS